MQQHQHADPIDLERPGHHWREPERVQWYVARMDRRLEERREPLTLLTRLLSFAPDTALQVLDIGAGYGAVASAVLTAFPSASATLLDISEEMMRVGAERMASYAGRYHYLAGDFADGVLPVAAAGPFHAVVSSLAIHHLPPAGKQSLYRDIATRLLPGGWFLNLDIVAAPDDAVAAVYRDAEARDRAARGGEEEPAPPPQQGTQHHSELQPLADHLRWLQDAGFVQVDCYWKRLGMALFGGARPA